MKTKGSLGLSANSSFMGKFLLSSAVVILIAAPHSLLTNCQRRVSRTPESINLMYGMYYNVRIRSSHLGALLVRSLLGVYAAYGYSRRSLQGCLA